MMNIHTNSLQNPQSLLEDDRNYVWHPFTSLLSSLPHIHISHAQDCLLYTSDGRILIDAIASWWVNLHGHANEYLAKTLYEQAQKMEHLIFAGFTHTPAIDIAKRILQLLPSQQAKMFFSDNGSTAVEVALKMALQFFHNQGISKKRIIAIEGAYHGDTFGAMAVGGRSPFNRPFEDLLFEVDFIPFPNEENKNEVIALFTHFAQHQECAAFIFEPLVQGAAGMRMYAPELLNTLISIAHENNVLCIADEVMTGFGRTGKMWASEYLSVEPDIFCLSKGITGGMMPLGVTTCSHKIVEAFESEDIFKTFFHGHSYTANPLSCAVANASLDLMLRPETWQNIQRIEQQHLSFVKKHKDSTLFKEVRSRGTILAVEFHTQGASSYFSKNRNALYEFFIGKNILLRPLGNVVYVLPPYIMTDALLHNIYEAIEEAAVLLA